jgi:3-hydroxyisobutyrate dehydrogenase-like beta-hydroxyacid dehydrogenase
MSNTTVSSPTIAVVGWGRMGGAMGSRLIDAGYRVTAVDIDEDARKSAERSGAEVADKAAAAVRVCEFVITMLHTPGAVQAVAQEEDGVLSGIQPGALWLEMSSSQPRLTRELSAAAADRKATFIDAPVSGGVKGARDGSLTIMVGASRDALNRAHPVLDVLGSRIVHVGDQPGLGDLAKTVNNMLSAANLAAAAEGLALGISGGLEPARLLDVLNGSTGASNATEVKIPNTCSPADTMPGSPSPNTSRTSTSPSSARRTARSPWLSLPRPNERGPAQWRQAMESRITRRSCRTYGISWG